MIRFSWKTEEKFIHLLRNWAKNLIIEFFFSSVVTVSLNIVDIPGQNVQVSSKSIFSAAYHSVIATLRERQKSHLVFSLLWSDSEAFYLYELFNCSIFVLLLFLESGY